MAEIVGTRKALKELPRESLGAIVQGLVESAAAVIAEHPHVELTASQRLAETLILSTAALLFAFSLFFLIRIALTLARISGLIGVRELPKKMF